MTQCHYLLSETNYSRLRDDPPNVAILPWGATEAHNFHLPYGTDIYEASAFAEHSARRAVDHGAKPIVLPTIPFGNNAQQLDQVATVSISTATATAILGDVARSLCTQSIDRLVILNAHGGNEFKPMVRDLQAQTGMLIVVVNFFQMSMDLRAEIFELPGDHADEMETSLMLHLHPQLVEMDQAGPGTRRAMDLKSTQQPGVWTPRPWSRIHPDTGCGDPTRATAAKGKRYFEAVCDSIGELIAELSLAQPGQLPYLDREC